MGGWDRGAGMEEQGWRCGDRDCTDRGAGRGLQGREKRHKRAGMGLPRRGIGEQDWGSGAGEKGIVYGGEEIGQQRKRRKDRDAGTDEWG